jgi:hypothetical protein
MNWFEKHLNLTAIIISFGGAIFTGVSVIFALGFNVPYISDGFSIEQKTYLILTFFLTALASFIAMAWVIRKKGRNWAFLFPFVPSLGLFVVVALVNFHVGINHRFGAEYDTWLILPYAVLFSFIWLIGMCIVLAIRNIREDYPDPTLTPSGEFTSPDVLQKKALITFRRPGLYIRLLLSIIAAVLIIAGLSCFRINLSESLFTYKPLVKNFPDAMLSFYVPESYYPDPPPRGIGYHYTEITFIRNQIRPFRFESAIFKVVVDYYKSEPDKSAYSDDSMIKRVTIDGIPAEYSSYILSDNQQVRQVSFSHWGGSWTVRMVAEQDPSNELDATFDRILSTLKIDD